MVSIIDAGTLTVTFDEESAAQVRALMTHVGKSAVEEAFAEAIARTFLNQSRQVKEQLWMDFQGLSPQDQAAIKASIEQLRPRRPKP